MDSADASAETARNRSGVPISVIIKFYVMEKLIVFGMLDTLHAVWSETANPFETDAPCFLVTLNQYAQRDKLHKIEGNIGRKSYKRPRTKLGAC